MIAVLENISFMIYGSINRLADSYLPGTGGSIYRLEAIKQIGGFDSNIKGVGEDQDAASRMKAANWLIGKSHAVFFEKGRQTWPGLWKQYFWHGYGLYSVYKKNRKAFSIARMSPIASFMAGTLYIRDAYEISHRKSVLLLPFHFAFKMAAWCFGFAAAESHLTSS